MTKSPKAQRNDLSATAVVDLAAAAADLVLFLNTEGVVEDVALGLDLDDHPGWKTLAQQRWSETVAKESRNKVLQLVNDAFAQKPSRAREVNQRVDGLGEVPFRFRVARLDDRRCVALGRDLRKTAAMQQRLVMAQQAMEQDYRRLRQADTRYRVLFHVCSEAVLVVDSASRRVVEANPEAANLLGETVEVLKGMALPSLVAGESRDELLSLLAAADAGAQSEATLRLEVRPGRDLRASAFVFREASSALILVRLRPAGADSALVGNESRVLQVMEALPEGVAVTDAEGRVIKANAAFCELVQRVMESQVVGKPIDRWLGRPGVDLGIILSNLEEHGVVRNFSTVVRRDFGDPQEAMVTAVSLRDGKVPYLGFAIRAVSSRLSPLETSSILPRSVEQMRELVGRVSLKEIVRESSDIVERLCIEVALNISGNNRALAAQLLGLSRQGLYSKLRRHGFAESESS